ncbi:transposition regulatory protein TnpB, partial [Listeria seeligeri FSL N1-067]
GRPFTQGFVREELNTLAIKQNIAGEDGEIYHFRMHEFRHTYAVKLLNNGADILTVQELLAHASPEMTMVYARYSDDNKRKEFEKVLASGTFEFSQNGLLQKIEPDQLNKENLDSLWQNHKLNAIDNPYGTCMARLNGKCPFINEPPCLSCNNGNPCKDLAIGLSDLDNEKYQLHIKTMTKTIELLKSNGRMDLVEKNEHLLEKYTDIERKITQGSIIYGRSNRTD